MQPPHHLACLSPFTRSWHPPFPELSHLRGAGSDQTHDGPAPRDRRRSLVLAPPNVHHCWPATSRRGPHWVPRESPASAASRTRARARAPVGTPRCGSSEGRPGTRPAATRGQDALARVPTLLVETRDPRGSPKAVRSPRRLRALVCCHAHRACSSSRTAWSQRSRVHDASS
jgi:hypothetical protein